MADLLGGRAAVRTTRDVVGGELRSGQSTGSRRSSRTVSIGIRKQLRNSTKKNLLSQQHYCSTADYIEDAADRRLNVGAGRMATGTATIERSGWEMFRSICDAASGRRRTWTEKLVGFV
jgi:hypothetical protein